MAKEKEYEKGIDLLTNLSNEKNDYPNKNSLHKKINESLEKIEKSKDAYEKEKTTPIFFRYLPKVL